MCSSYRGTLRRTDAAALSNIRRFAADISGNTPDDFTAITGTREVPEPAAPATGDETDLLASVDLDTLNRALTGEKLKNRLDH